MFSARLLIAVLGIAASGCTLFDAERGAFVASSVQVVALNAPLDRNTRITLLGFASPEQEIVGHETRRVSPALGTISFDYRFDRIDQANLRASIVESLRQKAALDVQDAGADTVVDFDSRVVVGVRFKQAGIVFGDPSRCIIDTEVSVSRAGKRTTTEIRVEGKSLMSVAATKDEAIRMYVERLAQVIAQP